MVKKLLPLLLASLLFGRDIDLAIVSLLGPKEYKLNQKFIQRLFSSPAHFFDEQGELDWYKISKTLKENGLLKLDFPMPMELEITFEIKDHALAFVGVLYDVLQSMGYSYFLIKQSFLDDKQFHFVLSMNTEYALDPIIFQERLSEYGYTLLALEKKELTKWFYAIKKTTFNYPKADMLTINQPNTKANLKGEYWYKINEGKSLQILNNAPQWYPKVIFFDQFFSIIEVITKEESYHEFKVSIPKETKFIKISDAFLPANTKNGLIVNLY